ncbi:hypothetical protein LTR97_004231 [Elasticomyces elasticus]|uniref:Prion-inhibition and propagation HeLo domain-containing protein n=1 Tax=Elasticomyces elasticus TaxID=574655 RepID=A0AAN7VTZ1_9PEZI|nr:hypothetical protein LTR97_004231 [Elasticomyces elasticus]
MAEVAGLVLGALPLFNVVVEDINYIQIGRDFTGRLETTNVRLSNARLQLLRWGETVREVEQRMDNTARTESITHANATVKCLHTLLEQGRQKVNHYGGADSNVPWEKAIPSSGDQDQHAAKCCEGMDKLCTTYMRQLKINGGEQRKSSEQLQPTPIIKTVFNKDMFRRRSSTDTKVHDRGASVRDKARWALFDEPMFASLMDRITKLFSDLERSFPAAQTVRLKLAADKVEQLKAEIADKICEYLEKRDDALARVLDDSRSAAKGASKEDAVTRVVNNFNGANNGGSQVGSMNVNGDFKFTCSRE